MESRMNCLCNILVIEPSGPEAPGRNKLHHHHAINRNITATMACKFTVNSAIQARLLRPPRYVRPSPQCAVSFRTIYEPRRLNYSQLRFPLILNSRSYSESTPNPPPPKDSKSTKGSQSPRSEDKNWLPSRAWIITTLVGTVIVGAGSIYMSFEIY